MKSHKHLIGKSFGKWTVIAEAGRNNQNKTILSCQCKCGTIKNIRLIELNRGRTKGCFKCADNKTPGGHNKTHGKSETRTYRSWMSMIKRCTNIKALGYKWYGARGIKVCDRWLKFENFLEDMGERPENLTLDRINNSGNYEPGNCRWATIKEQNSNTRTIKDIKTGKFINRDTLNHE